MSVKFSLLRNRKMYEVIHKIEVSFLCMFLAIVSMSSQSLKKNQSEASSVLAIFVLFHYCKLKNVEVLHRINGHFLYTFLVLASKSSFRLKIFYWKRAL